MSFYSSAWRGNWVRKHCKKWGMKGLCGEHSSCDRLHGEGPWKECQAIAQGAWGGKMSSYSNAQLRSRKAVEKQVDGSLTKRHPSMCSGWGLTTSCLGVARFKWGLIHISKTQSFGGKGLVVWGQHRGEMIPRGPQRAAAGLGKASG